MIERSRDVWQVLSGRCFQSICSVLHTDIGSCGPCVCCTGGYRNVLVINTFHLRLREQEVLEVDRACPCTSLIVLTDCSPLCIMIIAASTHGLFVKLVQETRGKLMWWE